jgi:hypothetical protein
MKKPKNRMKPITSEQVENVEAAIVCLRSARDLLKTTGGCERTIARVRLALTSAGGALRHVNHRRARTNSDGTSRRWEEEAR